MTRRDFPPLLDPRQREAAALLLCAISPAYDTQALSKQWAHAAKICPGFKVDSRMLSNRRALLERARGLVDAMLAEPVT